MKDAMIENRFPKVFVKENGMRKVAIFKMETQTEIVCRLKIDTNYFTIVEMYVPKGSFLDDDQTQIAVIKLAV